MAIDQAMLEQTSLDQIARLRIYQWAEPTVSLGYFQKLKDFEAYESTRGLSVVRRATGGGAIVHHHDWTYSVALPTSIANVVAHGASTRLYDRVHQAVIDWLAGQAIVAKQWSKPDMSASCHSHNGCSFLCFERRHEGDVECQGFKIMGSAQRRLGTAILQHGSLLLARSPFAPSLSGLQELAVCPENLTSFALALEKALSLAPFSIAWQEDSSLISLQLMQQAKSRFESSHWIARI